MAGAFIFAQAVCFAQSERAHIGRGAQPGEIQVLVETRNDKYYHLEGASDLADWRSLAGAGGTGTNLGFTIQTEGQERLFFRFVVEDNGMLRSVSNLVLQAETGFGEANLRSALLLSTNGVTNTDDLFNRFRSVYRVNEEVAKLQNMGLKIDVGNVIGLLREAELRTNLKPLEAQGFRPALTDALVRSRLDMSGLHRFMRRLPADQEGLMARDGYIEFKNALNEAGNVQVTLSEFQQLRGYVSNLQPVAGPSAPAKPAKCYLWNHQRGTSSSAGGKVGKTASAEPRVCSRVCQEAFSGQAHGSNLSADHSWVSNGPIGAVSCPGGDWSCFAVYGGEPQRRVPAVPGE